MKKTWEVKKLEEVCDFHNGLWKGKKPPYETVSVIRNTNFTKDGNLDDSDIAVLEVEEKQFSKRQLEYGDIILEKSGGGPKQPVGRVIIFEKKEGKYSFSNFTSVIRVKDSSQLNFVYLHKLLHFLYISGYTEKLQKHTTGIRNLDFTEYKNLSVPTPSLSEQKRIVKILDEKFEQIDELKKITEQQIVDTKELFGSRAENLFAGENCDWKQVYLGDVCKINDGTHFSPKNSSEGDYMYVTAKNIKPYGIDLSKVTYISKKAHDEIYARCSPKKGDILYIKDGATAGIAAINTIDEPFSLLSSVALFKCSEDIFNNFLLHYMNSITGKKNFLEYVGGAAITRLTLVKLKNISIPLPTKIEQQKIAKELDELLEKTKELEAIFLRKIADLDELKKSYLEQAFSGNL